MKGICFPGERTTELVTVPDPTPGPTDIVIEIKASGMCGTDLNPYRAPKGTLSNVVGHPERGPVIVGQEPCGVVVALGAEVNRRDIRVGSRVMIHHYDGCRVCTQCRTGWTQMCEGGAVVYGMHDHGGHAPYMKVAAHTAMPLPDGVSFAAGAAISCGTGTAWGALRRVDLNTKDTVAIFGQGPVGLAATQLARAMGARIIALDISDQRLVRARDFGADEVINPMTTDAVSMIRDMTKGQGADIALEASASPAARAAAVSSVRRWGQVCMVGVGGGLVCDNVGTDFIFKQVTLSGSWTLSNVEQVQCADFIERHEVRVDDLFTDRWTLDQASEAYALFDRQTSGKGVFLL